MSFWIDVSSFLLGHFCIRFQALMEHSFKCLLDPYEIEYNSNDTK